MKQRRNIRKFHKDSSCLLLSSYMQVLATVADIISINSYSIKSVSTGETKNQNPDGEPSWQVKVINVAIYKFRCVA